MSGLEAALDFDLAIHTIRPPQLRSATAAVLGALTPLPYHVWRQQSRTLHGVIARESRLRSFDLAIATLVHLEPYIRDLDAVRVVDTHNIDSLVLDRYAETLTGPRSAYARMTAAKLRDHERSVFARTDLVLVCSDTERRLAQDMAPGAVIRTVPNGVDSVHEFTPTGETARSNRIVFFGRLDYYPNTDAVRWFAEAVLPDIVAHIPDADVRIIGPGASADLRTLADRHPQVRFMGRVDRLRDEVGRADVVVVPLRVGGGTRLKILEALSLERPVVATRLGAEGLELTPGHDLVFADDPAAFAQAVVDLLGDPGRAARLGAAGRTTVRHRYDWSIIEQNVRSLLRDAVRDRAHGAGPSHRGVASR